MWNRNSQNVLQRRAEENMLSSMPQAATDALYEARQQRRKQLLKEQMAKKLWEDNYEGDLNIFTSIRVVPRSVSDCCLRWFVPKSHVTNIQVPLNQHYR